MIGKWNFHNRQIKLCKLSHENLCRSIKSLSTDNNLAYTLETLRVFRFIFFPDLNDVI